MFNKLFIRSFGILVVLFLLVLVLAEVLLCQDILGVGLVKSSLVISVSSPSSDGVSDS